MIVTVWLNRDVELVLKKAWVAAVLKARRRRPSLAQGQLQGSLSRVWQRLRDINLPWHDLGLDDQSFARSEDLTKESATSQ